MTLSEQDQEWLASVYPHGPYLWIMPWRKEMQFKAQDATNRLRSPRSGSSTLRKQPPGRGWVGPYPVSKTCEEATSWSLFWKHDTKNSAVFFRAISNSQAKNYMQYCVLTLSIALRISKLSTWQSVFRPETINLQLVNTNTAYCTKPTE
jgi:hypothetical protein